MRQTEEFTVAIDSDGAEILKAPYGAGERATATRSWRATEADQLLVDWQSTLAAVPTRDIAGSASPPTERRFDADDIGRRLAETLLPGRILDRFRESLAAARRSGNALRVRLVLRRTDSDALWHALPWELVFDAEKQDYLARSVHTPFVRAPAVPRATDRPPAAPPLRVLMASPAPRDAAPLQLEAEKRAIETTLQALGSPLEIHHVPPPVTLDALRRELLGHRPHLLHFAGHGDFDSASGEGCLLFEDGPRRGTAAIVGRAVAEALKTPEPLRLVVLNACRGATLDPSLPDPFVNVAGALVLGGQTAVIAMQLPILDQTALRFSRLLYDRLVGGDPIDIATNEARLRLYLEQPDRHEWATPVVYLRSDQGLLLQPAGSPDAGRPALVRQVRDVAALIQEKTRGFVGRQGVFAAIDKLLAGDGGCFVLAGDPGIGKTAVLAELVRRHRYIHHFNISGSAGSSRTPHFLANVCAQLIVRYGLDYATLPPEAKRDSGFLLELLQRALDVARREDPAARVVVLVDALDEVDTTGTPPNSNVLDLPVALPEGVFFILSRRRDQGVVFRFQGDLELFELDHASAANLADIATYIRSFLPRAGVVEYLERHELQPEELVAELLHRSEGNFMYLRYVLDEIEDGGYQDRAVDELPAGLDAYYEDHWRRLRARSDDDAWFDIRLPVLAAVTTVRKPVSVAFIAEVLGRRDRGRLAAALQDWSQFLHVEPHPREPELKTYRLYHGTFHDFVRRKDEVAEERVHLREMERHLVNHLRRRYMPRSGS